MNDKLSTVDDIVVMLDSMMSSGHGHVNVSVDPEAESDSIQTLGCTDCAKGDLACHVPTLHEGLDGEE